MKPGLIVITNDHRAGTIDTISGDTAWVVLRSGELWIGDVRMLREPQSDEDLASTVIEIEKPEPKRKKK